MNNQQRQLLESALELLHRIIGLDDAEKDFDAIMRSKIRFVGADENVIPFPGNAKKPLPTSEEAIIFPKTTDGVEEPSAETEQGFVYFTDKEILQMPKPLKQLILINRKRCHMRRRPCGNGFTYEIRFRAQGYNLSASGKTKELAKANMLRKIRASKPTERREDPSGIPTTFTAFALFYFENFRKEKVSELTYKFDLARLRRNLTPVFGERPLKSITPFDCKKLLDDIRGAGKARTAEDLHGLLSIIFKGAIAHGIIERNPIATVLKIIHERVHGSALTKDEERIMLDTLQGDFATCAALCLFCGLRPNELHDVRIEGDFVIARNSKRKHKRIEYKRIPIIDRLRPFLPPDGIVHVPTLDILRRRIRAALPGHKLYDLRTTFYSRCKEYGVADPARDHFMGHSLGALGNTYTDLSDDFLLKEGRKLNAW